MPAPKRPEPVTLTVRVPLQDVICFRASGIAPSIFAHAVASAVDRMMSSKEYAAALETTWRAYAAAQIAWDADEKQRAELLRVGDEPAGEE